MFNICFVEMTTKSL